MKKLTKINLHNLSQAELSRREENLLRGGEGFCICAGACSGANCGCLYYGEQTDKYDSYYGGSNTNDNNVANLSQLSESNLSNNHIADSANA